MHKRRSESGAVSLFLVIFAMLLITVVTLSFLRIMLKDQNASSINDLSKSALDSAQAGTEDAKRELIYYRTLCNSGDEDACAAATTSINSTTCNVGLKDVVPEVKAAIGAGETQPGEVQVAQHQDSSNDNDSDYNQAYTCVKMQLDTDDYVGSADANVSQLIPLKTNKTVSSITLKWYSPEDLGVSGTSVALGTTTPLLLQNKWAANKPSLMRAQLIQFGDSFKLSDFDNSTAANSDTNTLFLYPVGTTNAARPSNAADTEIGFDADVRKLPPSAPYGVQCQGTLAGGGFACSVTLTLPNAINQTTGRTAYLRLTPMYNATHYTVSFSDPTAKFSGVQPSIDSTGRANDQYRRVSTRVDLMPTNFTYPEAAIDITGDLCKDFSVTDNVTDYPSTTSCTP